MALSLTVLFQVGLKSVQRLVLPAFSEDAKFRGFPNFLLKPVQGVRGFA